MRVFKHIVKSFALFVFLSVFFFVFYFISQQVGFNLALERTYERMGGMGASISDSINADTDADGFDPANFNFPELGGGVFVLVLDSRSHQVWFGGAKPVKQNYTDIDIVSAGRGREIIKSRSLGDFAASYIPFENVNYAFYVAYPLSGIQTEVSNRLRGLFFAGGVFVLLAFVWCVADFMRRLKGVEISQIKQQFEEISAEREQYFQAFHLYFQAFNCAKNGMFIIGKDENIAFVNPAFEDLFGFVIGDISGRRLDYLIPTNQELTDLGFEGSNMHIGLIEHMWETVRDPSKGVWEGELPCQKKNGDVIWAKFFINAVSDIAGDIVEYIGIVSDITSAKAQEGKIRLEMYRAISELAETRDNETGKHLMRVSFYSRRIAEQMGMPRKYCQDMEIFSALHDIGKVGILDNILLAPRRITPEEFEIMKQHTVIGYEILRGKPTLEMAADIARCHHEKYDGTGYPEGFKGREIPLCARIVAVADVYDALRNKRHYKPGWEHDKVCEEIKNCSGSQFDPQVVDAFLSLEREFLDFSREHNEA